MTTETILDSRVSKYQKVEFDVSETFYQDDNHSYQMVLDIPHDSGSYEAHQDILLYRALLGLSVYESDEVKAMHWEKRRRIKRVHARTTEILNIWKQELIIKYTNPIFDFMLSVVKDRNCPEYKSFLADMRDCKDTDPDMENPFTFRELGITKDQVIDKLIEHRILPKHFRELDAPIVKQKT